MPIIRRGLRRPLSRAAAITATAALLPALALAGAAASPASPDAAAPADPSASGPPLVLRAPAKVTAWSYDNLAYTGFGLRLVAPVDPVEIRSHRLSWDEEITSTWLSPDGPRELPAGSMETFAGLSDFITVSLTRLRDGKRLPALSLDGCLNGDAQRVHPDAPARSRYPLGCPWNPYTVGSVMGVEGGFASAPVQEWNNPLQLRPGRYDVRARIAPTYAELFGLSREEATEELRLVVRREESRMGRPGPATEVAPLPQPAAHEPTADAAPPAEGPRPDLRSLPAWDIGLNRKGTVLRFAATVWNAGDSPLVVDGFRGEGQRHMRAYQYFFDAEGQQTGYQRVGQMHWHAENHQHWHFEDFAQYSLLDADRSQVVLSGKQSFCLANTDAVDYTVAGADWHPEGTDLSTACGGDDAISVRQVLASGSGDTYHQFRYGQAFGVKHLPDGTYHIAVRANPMRDLVESDTTNNDAVRKIRLWTDRQDRRRVKVFAVGIVDEGASGYFRSLARR